MYHTANASLLDGVHHEAPMTFLRVCSSCRLGLSRLAGPDDEEKGGYMVAVVLGRLPSGVRAGGQVQRLQQHQSGGSVHLPTQAPT